MERLKSTIFVLFAFALCSCSFKEFEDISSETSVANMVSLEYETKTLLLLNGITLDRNYKDQIDYYTIMKPPGVSGPEVKSKYNLRAGTFIRIIKVEQCRNCFPFPAEIRLVVDILSDKRFKSSKVTISQDRVDINDQSIFTKR